MTLRILSSFSFCGNFQLSIGSVGNVGFIYNVTMLPFYNDMHMLWHKNQTLCCNFAKMLPLLLTYLDDDSNLQFIIQNADDILNVIQ